MIILNDIKVVNLVVPQELYQKIKDTAKQKNISMSALIRLILTENLQ